jgi:hypothetical protein
MDWLVYIEVRDAETPFSRCWCIPLEVVSCCYMSKHDDNMMCWTKLFCVLRLIGLADTIRIVDVNYLRCHGSTHIWQSKHHLKPILHLSLPHPLYLHSPPPMPHNPSITKSKVCGYEGVDNWLDQKTLQKKAWKWQKHHTKWSIVPKWGFNHTTMSTMIVTKNWFLWDNDIWVASDLSLATSWKKSNDSSNTSIMMTLSDWNCTFILEYNSVSISLSN